MKAAAHTNPSAPAVDHLIFGAPDLERAVTEVESRLGVRPVPGGSHPMWGTRNAILSLGDRCYLEVLAPDPGLEAPEWGRLFGVDQLTTSRLVGWAVATDRLAALAEEATASGLPVGLIGSGGRARPDGTELNWTLTDPRAVPRGGVIPFLIDWGGSTHPGSEAPFAGELEKLCAAHPSAPEVRWALGTIGVDMAVESGEVPLIEAHIRTSSGIVVLR